MIVVPPGYTITAFGYYSSRFVLSVLLKTPILYIFGFLVSIWQFIGHHRRLRQYWQGIIRRYRHRADVKSPNLGTDGADLTLITIRDVLTLSLPIQNLLIIIGRHKTRLIVSLGIDIRREGEW